MTSNPDKMLMRVNPDKFASHPSMPLVDTPNGSFHSTACHNLPFIAENGILPGMEVADSSSGRLRSHFGVFARWDRRNRVTKYRVPGSRTTPLAVLYFPTPEIIRLGGKLTESGMVIVSRPIPFKFVKEIWFCIPDPDDMYAFETIETILQLYNINSSTRWSWTTIPLQ